MAFPPEDIKEIINALTKATQKMPPPMMEVIVKEYGRDPYLVLIACLLSLRTKDTISLPAARRIFCYARTPVQMLNLSILKIQKEIYPVGFYRKRSENLREVSQELVERFDGTVPASEAGLLSLPGVGRKTANLVLGMGFGIPALCVDTHVHRISNRLGLVRTKTSEQTEEALKLIIPKKNWIQFNNLLVTWGQNVCSPLVPKCSDCAISQWCKKVGVTKSK